MSRRVHYYSWALDREFTFPEWCDYLKARPDFKECGEVALDLCGFHYNVHGRCINPHTLTVRKEGTGLHCYYDLRTFITPKGELLPGWKERRPLPPVGWTFDIFGINCGATGGYPGTFGDEQAAIVAGLEQAARGIKSQIGWYERAIANHADENMGYGACLARCRAMLALTREEYDKQTQLSLF